MYQYRVEYYNFSGERNDIRTFNQEVVGGGVRHFQCNKLHLLAIREAKAIASAFCLVIDDEWDTPKMATRGHGDKETCRALDMKSKKEAQYEASFGQLKNVWVWSAGEKEHLVQKSSVSGNNLGSLALVRWIRWKTFSWMRLSRAHTDVEWTSLSYPTAHIKSLTGTAR